MNMMIIIGSFKSRKKFITIIVVLLRICKYIWVMKKTNNLQDIHYFGFFNLKLFVQNFKTFKGILEVGTLQWKFYVIIFLFFPLYREIIANNRRYIPFKLAVTNPQYLLEILNCLAVILISSYFLTKNTVAVTTNADSTYN